MTLPPAGTNGCFAGRLHRHGCHLHHPQETARRNRLEVQVSAEQQREHPHVFTQAAITYLVSGHNISEAAVIRAIELSATKYCPAQAMLVKVFPIELVYEIYEEKDGVKELIAKGAWQPKK